MMRVSVPLVFLLVLPLQAQQLALAEPESCTIEGQVVDAGTGEPLKKAHVMLQNPEDFEQRQTAVTDGSGRFRFADVRPGRYRLFGGRNGYARQEYGQRRPGRPGTVLTLAPGQQVTDILFRLVPAGVIAGRIYDEDGEPAAGTIVQAMQYRYFQGQRQLSAAQQAAANDLGEYRFYGLAPGRYYVEATYIPAMAWFFGGYFPTASGIAASGESEGYAPTYYPGTNDAAGATPIELGPRDEVRAIDFRLSLTRTVRVRGHIFNGVTGRPGRDAHVQLMPKDAARDLGFLSLTHATVNRDGTFEIGGVRPGSYVLIANWRDGEKRYSTQVQLEVGTTNVEGVELVIRPGVNVEGRVVIEGRIGSEAFGAAQPSEGATPTAAEAELDLAELQISLQPRDEIPWGGGRARVKEDGTFVVENVGDGDYEVSLWRLPGNLYLKAAHLGTTDVLEEGFSLGGGAPPGSLELILSPNGARVEGTVLNADNQPLSGATVVLIPEPRRRDQSRLYEAASTDQYGHFQLRGIAPGEYKLFAWEEIERGAYRDPDFLRPHEKRGEVVRLAEGETKSLSLTVIPTEETPF